MSNQLLRTSVARDPDGAISLTLVWEDVAAKSKWSVSVALTDDQLEALLLRAANILARKR